MMKNLTRTKKILTICIILNVIIFGMYGFLFLNIKSKNEKVYDLLSEADRDIKRDETLRSIKASLNENQDFISKTDSLFIPSDGVVNFIDLLEGLATQSGVDLGIGSVSVEADSKDKDDFKEILRLKLETEGSWQNLFHFLSLLENIPYRVELEGVSFVLAGASDSILFSGTGARVRSSGEVWKGSFDVLVYKLR